jgi:hypothetical protein
MLVRTILRVCAIISGVLLLWLACNHAFGQCPGGVCPARRPAVVVVPVQPVAPLPEPAIVVAPKPAKPIARAAVPPYRHGRRVYVVVPQVK